MKHSPQNGFVALLSILILSAVLLTTTLGLAQFGIANRFFILNLEQKAASEKLAEACVQIARIKTYNDTSYTITSPLTISIADDSCLLYSVVSSGSHTTIEAKASNGDSVSNLRVLVDNTTGDFITWEEVNNF